MANYRPVNGKIWINGTMDDLSGIARSLYVYLRTTPLRNESGLFQAKISAIANHMGFTFKQIASALGELETDRKIFYDVSTSEIWLIDGLSELTKNVNAVKSAKADVDKCLSPRLRALFLKTYGKILNLNQESLEPLQDSSRGPIGLELGLELELGSEGGVGETTEAEPEPALEASPKPKGNVPPPMDWTERKFNEKLAERPEIPKDFIPALAASWAKDFWYFYDKKGWKVGKDPMTRPGSAVAGWIIRNITDGSLQRSLAQLSTASSYTPNLPERPTKIAAPPPPGFLESLGVQPSTPINP